MATFPPVSCVLLDYGGTLDTDARHWAGILWDAYRDARIPITQEQFHEAYVFGERALAKAPIVKPHDDFRAMLLHKATQELAWLDFRNIFPTTPARRREAAEAIADFCNNYALQNIRISRDVLRRVGERHRLVLVSNFYGNLQSVLSAYELDIFYAVVESARVGVRKPDPRIWQLGLEAAGCAPEQAAAVGDSFAKDIRPAHSLGCRTIWLQGEGWNGPEAHDDALPDAIVHHLADILPLLT